MLKERQTLQGQGRHPARPAATDLRRQTAGGRPNSLGLQHPEGHSRRFWGQGLGFSSGLKSFAIFEVFKGLKGFTGEKPVALRTKESSPGPVPTQPPFPFAGRLFRAKP